MTAGPGNHQVAGRGRLRASHADREQVIDVLKAAYVQGRLDRDELDERVGLTLAARTYAELASVIDDIPWGATRHRPPRRPAAAIPAPAPPPASAARWALGGLFPVSLMTATLLVGDGYLGGVLWVVTLVSFMVWVLVGLLTLRLRLSEQLERSATRPAGPPRLGPDGRGPDGRGTDGR